MTKNKFAGLPAAARKTHEAVQTPKLGRTKVTAPDSGPVTLHLSAEVLKQARLKLLQTDDKRPLSTIVDALLARWASGSLNV